MIPIADTVAANLTALKQEGHITSDASLAKLAGVDQKTIWRILTRNSRPPSTRLKSWRGNSACTPGNC